MRKFGKIYSPENPNEIITGAWLNISDSAIFIECPFNYYQEERWNILYGEFNGFDKISLINCYTGGGANGAGGSFRRIIVSYIIKDEHIKNLSDTNISKVILHSPALSSWIMDTEGINTTDFKSYQIPSHKPIFKTELDDFNIQVSLGYSTTYNYNELSSSRLSEIKIESKGELNLSNLSNILFRLKKLILFITNKNPEFSNYFVFFDSDNAKEIINTNKQLEEERFTKQFDIRYYDVKDDLADITKNWFLNEKLYPVIDLVLQKCFNTQLSPAAYFLNVCVAIESFHRRFGNNNRKKIKLDAPEKKAAIENAISQNEDLLKWFKSMAKDWEKPTLKHRLLEFKETLELLVKDIYEEDLDELIVKIVQTRNEMAHEGVYDKRFDTETDLFLISKVLEFTIRLELLNHFGFDIKSDKSVFLERAKRSLEVLFRLNNK